MTAYATALEIILSKFRPLPTERVPLGLASGRALIADALAAANLPARDNSAMDGYAVRAADLGSASAESPVALRIVERITAGDSPQVDVGPGQTARIFTGGALPAGADSVVMQEDVALRDGQALFAEPCGLGEHVRRAGDDIRVGDVAVRAGQPLGASELALLASLGRVDVQVPRRPKVALISTGDELVEVGHDGPGKLVDSNSVALAIRLRELGAEVVPLGVVRDDPALIRARFEAAVGCDVVVSSAGVSVGDKDYVREVLASLGAEVHIERLAIRPGKPLVFASTARQFFFGLPGNPVSSRVTFEVFVRPAIRALLGDLTPVRTIPAALERDFPKVEALTYFTRVTLRRDGDRLLACPMSKQGSNALTSLVGAQGLAVMPSGSAKLAAGTVVEVILL